MKAHQYLIISVACVALGLIFCAYYYEWLIVRIPTINTEQFHPSPHQICKKKVMFYYWHHEAWHHEETELIWSDDLAKTIELLLNTWLSLLDEEGVVEKRITVQSVALCPRQQEAYLSFDRYVRFLVHHEPLQDYHLDFSNPWPISGFLQ